MTRRAQSTATSSVASVVLEEPDAEADEAQEEANGASNIADKATATGHAVTAKEES
jgi:hypothetical protein